MFVLSTKSEFYDLHKYASVKMLHLSSSQTAVLFPGRLLESS